MRRPAIEPRLLLGARAHPQGMHGKTARISLQDLPPIVSSVLNVRSALAGAECVLAHGSNRLSASSHSYLTALTEPPLVASHRMQAAAACPDDSERYCHIPAALEQQLMPFQREGIRFALRHGGRALIGDEVRRRRVQGDVCVSGVELKASWEAAGAGGAVPCGNPVLHQFLHVADGPGQDGAGHSAGLCIP